MTKTQFKSINEAPLGFTHGFTITAADLTETTDNTAQVIDLITVPAGTLVASVATRVVTAFEDASDNALNTTALTLGDAGSANRYMASQELNANGSTVVAKAQPSTVPYATVAETTLKATFGSMASKDLASVDVGEVHIFLKLQDLDKVG